MKLVNRSTKNKKNCKEVESYEMRFYFWKQLTSQLLMSLNITWNQKNFYLNLHRMQLRDAIIQVSIAQNFKANGTHDYCYKKISKNINRFINIKKSDELDCNTPGSQLGLKIMRTRQDPTK